MHILDLKKCHFVKYSPANNKTGKPTEYVKMELDRDEQWLERNLPALEAFWKRIVDFRACHPDWQTWIWTEENLDPPEVRAQQEDEKAAERERQLAISNPTDDQLKMIQEYIDKILQHQSALRRFDCQNIRLAVFGPSFGRN